MKKILFILFTIAAICAFTISANAQEYTRKASGSMSYVNEAEATGEIENIQGTPWNVFKTTKGSKFIKCLSPRTGNNYPVWIGVKNGEHFEGEPIRVSKKGSLFILVLSNKTNNPYPVWIEKQT